MQKLAGGLPVGRGVFRLVSGHSLLVKLPGMIGEALPGDVDQVVPVGLGAAEFIFRVQQQPPDLGQGRRGIPAVAGIGAGESGDHGLPRRAARSAIVEADAQRFPSGPRVGILFSVAEAGEVPHPRLEFDIVAPRQLEHDVEDQWVVAVAFHHQAHAAKITAQRMFPRGRQVVESLQRPQPPMQVLLPKL